MSQERLNSLLTLHIHKENALALSLSDISNNFVSAKENRMTRFGFLVLSCNFIIYDFCTWISIYLLQCLNSWLCVQGVMSIFI